MATDQEVKTAISKRDAAIERGYAFSPQSLADHFGIRHTRVRSSIKTGHLRAFRLGKLFRIRPEAIGDDLLTEWIRPAPKRTAGLPAGSLVYFLVGTPGYVKIGFTRNLAARVIDLQVGCPALLTLAAWVAGDQDAERQYHRRFAAHRCAGEWFSMCDEIEAEIARLKMEE